MPIIIPFDAFPDAESAGAPLSANTEVTLCSLYECNGSDNPVYTPHPTYTNGRGKAVEQLNAVTIGGFNGLNS